MENYRRYDKTNLEHNNFNYFHLIWCGTDSRTVTSAGGMENMVERGSRVLLTPVPIATNTNTNAHWKKNSNAFFGFWRSCKVDSFVDFSKTLLSFSH